MFVPRACSGNYIVYQSQFFQYPLTLFIRLKMNFVNVGTPQASLSQNPNSSSSTPILNHGSAPVLASVYSDVFQVFSAKKFPGVIESTPLSKCFAIQGIKIPIRKDGVKGGRGGGAPMMLKDDADGDEQYDE